MHGLEFTRPTRERLRMTPHGDPPASSRIFAIAESAAGQMRADPAPIAQAIERAVQEDREALRLKIRNLEIALAALGREISEFRREHGLPKWKEELAGAPRDEA
jgi:hypothetical protein